MGKEHGLGRIKVLVVDDHAVLRDGIRALLEDYPDIEIVGEATEGKESITSVEEMNPDVVLMDIVMPGMDGLEATRRITKKYPKVKVLVLSQYDGKEYIISAIKAGAAGYLPKRALGSELVAAIRAIHEGESFLYPSAAAVLINDYLHHVEGEPYDRLTSRERAIFKMMAEGSTSREISEAMSIGLKTVMTYRAKIMKKLYLNNHIELVKFAMRNGIVGVS